MRLEDKVALITGGASGIGRGLAIAFAKEGASIAILDVNEEGAKKVAEEVKALRQQAIALKVDVSSFSQVRSAVEKVIIEFQKIDILVNSAGYRSPCPFEEMSEEVWDRMIGVCLKGTFNCSRWVLPHMLAQKKGRIINMSSAAGVIGVDHSAHYAAAKAGVTGLTKALAKIVAGHGDITCNSLAPGLIDTPFYKGAQDFFQKGIQATLLQRAGTVEDVANACLYLASDEGAYLTGVNLNISGGLIVGPT